MNRLQALSERIGMGPVYEIGPFRLDPDAGVLTHMGQPMALGARAVAVLTALVERPNEYVQKSSILDAAWPDVVVEEGNLAVQISSIRRVLARAPGGERWVETLARRGYRFVGPVSEITGDQRPGARGGGPITNLSEPLTSFIGRERELVEIKRLLPDSRLLTLVGIGGIGKTRLALQVAAEVMAAYRNGVWLVNLAPLADPALVPSAVAQVLGVREAAGKPLIESLCGQVKGRQLLLVLDNCEHVLEACAQLADAMLRGAADLTIIATSREPLHVAGEKIHPLVTLSLPEHATNARSVARSEAVQLFVERAREQLPEFALTDVRAPVIAELCIQLDGIPLALELAAARIRTLSIEQITARLDNRFKLLTSGTGNAPPRQKTLRATLDWSYDLLTEQQRVVLRRVGIFSGGFNLDAGSAVAAEGAIDHFAVIDLLSQLVARSLVVADTNTADTRYRLLESTRAYALEKLAESGENDAIKRRHAQFFRELFETAFADWLRMTDADWRTIYPPELDNVRSALEWSLGPAGDEAIAVGLAGASGPVWTTLSLYREGLQRLEAAAACDQKDTSEADQARLWVWLGSLWEPAEPATALAAFERAIRIYQELDDPLGLGLSKVWLARVLATLGRLELSTAALAEAWPAIELAGLPKVLGFHFANSGFLKMQMDDPHGARSDRQRALALYREAGSTLAVAATLHNLATVDWALGDLDAAEASFREAVSMHRMLGHRGPLGFTLANLAGVLTARGNVADALDVAREGVPLLGDSGDAWIFMHHLALRAALAGMITNAARLSGYASAVFVAKGFALQQDDAQAHARLHALLREKLAPDRVEHLLAKGARMSEDDACRLALQN
jgi:predicted ATPase/DNA-binding winged helix-turn-helix (wHTH) protein